jgi:hypothetical protein
MMIRDGAGNERGANVNASNQLTVSVDNTVTVAAHAVTNAGTFVVQENGAALTSLQLIDDTIATVASAITAKGVAMAGTDGTNARILKTDTSGELQIDVLTLPALAAGANAIGKLAANSGVDIGDVDVTSLPAIPAGTNLIGRTSSSPETSTIYNGTTALTPKFAIIDAATSGDNTLLAAVTSKKIRVHALWLVAAGTVNVRFESGAGGTALSGQANLVANTGFVLDWNPAGWFETASNTLLNLELSAAISCDGGFLYTEV